MEPTETSERFEGILKKYLDKLNNSKLCYEDGIKLYELSENLKLRYEEIRKSRESWKKKYWDLKGSLKE